MTLINWNDEGGERMYGCDGYGHQIRAAQLNKLAQKGYLVRTSWVTADVLIYIFFYVWMQLT